MKFICKDYPYNPRLEREDDQATHYGVVFYRGEASEVSDSDVAEKLAKHPSFEVANESSAKTETAKKPKPRKKAAKKKAAKKVVSHNGDK